VTTFFLKHEIDTGSIIFQEKEPIHDTDDVGSLYERLMKKGAGLVLKTVEAIASGKHLSQPQSEAADIKHAPKIFKETCEVNWNQPAEHIHNFIRGLSPYPAAWTTLNGKTFKIFKTDVLPTQLNSDTGPIQTDNKTYLYHQTSNGSISILELQPEGKKRMTIAEFFRGNKI
jgi:methionyl-tRNA formyltransferase